MECNHLESIKIFIVLNPVAGFTNPYLFRQRVKRISAKYNFEFEIYETKENDGEIRSIIDRAYQEGVRTFVAAGGDGTISDLASYLIDRDVEIGIIPCGTGNALAKSLGIPLDIGSALRLIMQEHSYKKLDALKVFNKYHLLNVGIGITSTVAKNTTRPLKRRLGIFAYIIEAIKTFIGIQPYSFLITVDGHKYHFRASEIFIACGGWLGIQLPFTDLNILPDDGRADIFIIKARNIWGYIQLFINILFGKPHQAPQMKYLPANKEIRIESRIGIPVQSDGDWIGTTPVTINVCQGVINMIIPKTPFEPLIIKWRRLIQNQPIIFKNS